MPARRQFVLAADKDDPLGRETVSGPAGEQDVAGKPVVLIAEDTESNYMLINALLRKDYKLYRALDGTEAVEMCRELNPDIVLMDIRMPRMDGLEATRRIREFNLSVPILAVTAFAYGQDEEEAIKAGCNDFLTKPISVPLLRSAILKWLKI